MLLADIASKPRLALLHYSAPPTVGGVELVMVEHARLFLNAGYPVAFVVGRGEAAELPAGIRLALVPEIDSEHSFNLELVPALARGELPATFTTLRDGIAARLAEALAESDVVLAHNVMTMQFNLALLAALHKLLDEGRLGRVIVWCHDVARRVRSPAGEALNLGYPWSLLRRYRPDVTYVAVSVQRQQLLAHVLGCPPERILPIPNGVDVNHLLGLSPLGQSLVDEFHLLESDLILLMPIRITKAKNIEFALQVTADLRALGLRPKLIVTGPPDPHRPEIDDYFAELQDLRRSLQLEGEVVFVYEGSPRLGRPLLLEASHVGELYRICDLVLMPSHREGFGLPVLEAGLMDRAVFATRIPAVEEIGAENVFVIQPDESSGAVARRIQLWSEQDHSHRLRRRVRRTYPWPAIFERFLEPLLTGRLAPPAEKGAV